MSMKSVAEKYFSSINPIATRLYNDMEETKSSYEELWANLSEEEQKQILTESIIKPEVSVKYSVVEDDENNSEFAVKLIIDDNNCSYRDEHSGPFSFKTKSQRDLTLFERDKSKKSEQHKVQKIKPKARKIVENPPEKFPVEINENAQSLLPKTGLDFLDNW